MRYRLRYPGLGIDPGAFCDIKGRFEYGAQCAIGVGSNLIVPTTARLLLGRKAYVGRYVELGPGGTIEVGDQASLQDRCIVVGDVSIGRYCLLSLNVLLTSGKHHFDLEPHLLIRDQDRMVEGGLTNSSPLSRPILIGEDCWLGMNSVVMPGVSVGRGCVIGSNSVVTSDLPPYSVAVGVPARIIRSRLDFVPPRRLDWQDVSVLPYFYSGFELAQAERSGNRPAGGHVASGRSFSVWLAESEQIGLRIRALDQPVQVQANDTTALIGQDWQEVSFRRSGASAPCRFAFSGGSIAISEVWAA